MSARNEELPVLGAEVPETDVRGAAVVDYVAAGVEVEAAGDFATDPAGAAAAGHAGHHGYIGDKTKIQNRLRRIEGQVRGVQRMVDEEAYCIDIVTQISAVKSAIDRVAMVLLEDHLSHCVAGAVEASVATGDSSEAQAKIREASAAIERLIKS